MGFGAQMILWPDGFCEELARGGSAWCGLTIAIAGARRSSTTPALRRFGRPLDGDLASVPYTLSDMAGDAAGVLDALGIDSAHVVGASLGGMVAQMLAIERAERVRSLASVMSTTGDPAVGRPTPAALEVLITRPPADRAGYIESTVRARKVIGSPRFPISDEYARENAALGFDRAIHPDGTTRQAVAMITTGDRTERLAGLSVPTVVIHGADDPLITVSGGEATAAAIPAATSCCHRRYGPRPSARCLAAGGRRDRSERGRSASRSLRGTGDGAAVAARARLVDRRARPQVRKAHRRPFLWRPRWPVDLLLASRRR